VTGYRKPERWKVAKNRLFPYQVGFTSPPHDFDAAPSDFLRLAPETVGVHGRMLHVPAYAHELTQRVDNFHLLEEFVHCMANNGVDVCGQVGTNWSHAGGRTPEDIAAFCKKIEDTYETPLHMAGYCLVEGLREIGAEKIALNSVYYWPAWRDGTARFLRDAGFDVLYAGNLVDLGFYETQEQLNDEIWIMPGDMAEASMIRTAEQAPNADAIVVNGMPNWRGNDGLPRRTVHHVEALEAAVGKPIISSDFALYWRIFKTLGVTPEKTPGRLLSTLG